MRDFVEGVESSVVHYGDTTLTFLSNLQRADDRGEGLTYISAVTIEEKSVWDYNQGNPTGDPATLGDHAPPSVPLVAIYPKEGTLISDHPWVTLNAPWVTTRNARRRRASWPSCGRPRSSSGSSASRSAAPREPGRAHHARERPACRRSRSSS